MNKKCSRCQQMLNTNMFSKCKTNNDGLQFECKQCKKRYYKNNPESYKQHSKQWHKDNPEYIEQYRSQLLPGVYMVKCLINGKKYVGESIKPVSRRMHHFSNHTTDKSKRLTNTALQADIKLYGKDKFVFGIIEHCNENLLLERETYYINLYKPEYN